jgi:RNA polymerase sigma-70 factor (ECF subfamily)
LDAHESDLELARQARRGDQAAFVSLVDRHGDELMRLARMLLGNAADAEDVVQETLLGAYRSIGRFEGRSSLRTWLVRILTNHVSKFRRSRKVRRAMSLEDSSSVERSTGNGRLSADTAMSPSGPARQTESPMTQTQHRIDIPAMLQTLSPDHREVIVLREIEQMSYQQIADVLGVPRGTVESRLHRARQELKVRFADYLS